MQQRRGTAQQWTDADPILAAGEIGFETDTSQFKIGDGVNAWSDLSYFKNLEDLGGTLDDYIPLTQRAANNGVATLDGTGKIPVSQLGNLINGAPAALDTLNEIATMLGDGSTLGATVVASLSSLDSAIGVVQTNLNTHEADTTNIHGIGDTTQLATLTSVSGSISTAVSTHTADTTDIHGIADTALLATKNYADSAVSTHGSDTTDVHGIADTALLATKNYADTAVSTHSSDTTDVHGIADTALLSTKSYADTASSSAVSTHNAVTTNVHGIADTAALATKAYADTAEADAITAAGTAADTKISTAVAALTKSSVGLVNVDNTSDANKPVSSATQTALDAKAPLAGPTFTGTVALPSTTSIGNVSSTELGYLDGVTSSVQTQLTARLPLSGGTMTGALTLSGAPTSDLHAATKLYVDNVTAGINFHESVHAASVNSLAANYSNGTSGVGATLTADTNRAFAVLDGETVVLGERVLVKNQTDAKQNGIYTLTTVGSVSAPWVLTRATDADNNPTGEMKTGDFTFVQRGTINASVGYINNSTANPIVIGTDNISYTEFNAGKTVVAGSGLTEAVPGTISVATGGVTSAMIADGTIVDGDINASAAIAQSKISGLTSDLAAKAPTASPTFTGTVTVAASGVAFTDGTQTAEGVPSRTPIIQKSASYTLSALTERDDLIEMGSGSAMTLTIPTDATLNFPIGTSLDILQTSTGQVTIAGAGGVTVNATPGLKLRTQWSSATLFKRAANTWVVYGDLMA